MNSQLVGRGDVAEVVGCDDDHLTAPLHGAEGEFLQALQRHLARNLIKKHIVLVKHSKWTFNLRKGGEK